MIKITPTVSIHESELKFTFVRAPGPGGQNVNKLATAAQLRFNIQQSHLPEETRERLLSLLSNKITSTGDLIIKASRYRTQEQNKQDAIDRLIELIKRVITPPKLRKKTKPTRAAKQKRLTQKKLHGKMKSLRSHKPTSDL